MKATTGAAFGHVRDRQRLLRYSTWDAVLVVLSIAQGVALVTVPSIPLVGLGLWWNANTVAHNFIHLPFFRSPWQNRAYSAYLSLVLGVPQTLWRRRHLAHHAGRAPDRRLSPELVFETLLVLGLWTTLASVAPRMFLTVYLPGWLLGLGLCQLQGFYEHARGTTSHYGRIYNALFFNDGYHVEHHARPAAHWSGLRDRRQVGATASRWPPVLRWLDAVGLNGLERLVLASPFLQRFVLNCHGRAFRALLPAIGEVRSITIVGGGLFPRTALVLSQLAPRAALTIVEADTAHLETAKSFLGDSVTLRRELFDPRRPIFADLIVVPLAYVGDRQLFYERPPARAVLVHDWIWAWRARGVVVSWLLFKRLNLVLRANVAEAVAATS